MRFRSFLALTAAFLLLAAPARAHTRDQVRALYGAISDWSSGELYLIEPSVTAP